MAVEADANDDLNSRLIGASPSFRAVKANIRRFSQCDAPVLIEGETGTGKELVARALHYLSPRGGGPFVPVNCGALPEQLIVNELFGHERGAFTGADKSAAGLVAQARDGTIFFDEVDALPLTAQAVVLRFLQDQEYRPLGNGAVRTGNVRVIAASNACIKACVEARCFREDLFYRLNVLGLGLPPLREREEDILLLATHFLDRFGKVYGALPKTLSRAAQMAMRGHDWPGNVRELENRIHRAFVLTRGPELCAQDIGFSPVDEPAPSPSHASAEDHVNVNFAVAKARAVSEFEYAYLYRLMSVTHGNISAASRLSGKERRTLTRLLRKHGIERETFLTKMSR